MKVSMSTRNGGVSGYKFSSYSSTNKYNVAHISHNFLQGAHLILPPWILEIFSDQVGLTLETWNVKELSVNGP